MSNGVVATGLMGAAVVVAERCLELIVERTEEDTVVLVKVRGVLDASGGFVVFAGGASSLGGRTGLK